MLWSTEINNGNEAVEIKITIIPTDRKDLNEIKKNHSGYLNKDADSAIMKAGTDNIILREIKYLTGSFESNKIQFP